MIKKVLCSLIIGLTLIGFSSASEMINEGMIQVNIPEDVNISGRGYSFYLNGNIYTDGYGQYLYWKNNGTNKTLQYIYGRNNGRLYFFGTTTDLNNRITQGYINSFCKSSSVSGCYPVGNSYTIVSADDFYGLNPNITKIAVGNNSTALNWSNNDWGFYLCYYNNNDSNYYCAISAPVPSGGNYKWSSLTGSLGFTSIDNAQSYNWGFSSFNKSIPLPDYSVNPGQCLSNTEVLMGFEYMGLSQEYCYGGFSMDNLFLPGESFEDFTGYSFGYGTTIFNLHYVYSGGLSMKPFLSSYYQSFLNGQLNNFYNKSKALLMFFQQYQSANDRGRGDFNLNDLNDYCTLLFTLTENNWANDNECYTGGNKSAPISYNLNKSSNSGGFSFTGVLGGNGTGFSTPDEFFGRLNTLFQTNINGINSTFPSMIPSYIVFFMLAIILIRIISH